MIAALVVKLIKSMALLQLSLIPDSGVQVNFPSQLCGLIINELSVFEILWYYSCAYAQRSTD
jgi:hypothetical protein